jgi:predicted enzyme related to lactoylglutathione lyase
VRKTGKIDYVEFPGTDLAETRRFYGQAFGWTFEDYGPDYIAFDGQGANGGFVSGADAPSKPMTVLYAYDIDAMLQRVRAAGGTITRAMFRFPGGRRFHFRDPSGNELAVWTAEVEPDDGPEPIAVGAALAVIAGTGVAMRDYVGREYVREQPLPARGRFRPIGFRATGLPARRKTHERHGGWCPPVYGLQQRVG